MHNFRVLKITRNIKGYPDCEKDTLEFPELVEEVEDEMQIFIYCLENEVYWEAEDFFNSVNIESFYSRTPVTE